MGERQIIAGTILLMISATICIVAALAPAEDVERLPLGGLFGAAPVAARSIYGTWVNLDLGYAVTTPEKCAEMHITNQIQAAIAEWSVWFPKAHFTQRPEPLANVTIRCAFLVLTDAGGVGQANVSVLDGHMLAVDIELVPGCLLDKNNGVQCVAHELGHALGLKDPLIIPPNAQEMALLEAAYS